MHSLTHFLNHYGLQLSSWALFLATAVLALTTWRQLSEARSMREQVLRGEQARERDRVRDLHQAALVAASRSLDSFNWQLLVENRGKGHARDIQVFLDETPVDQTRKEPERVGSGKPQQRGLAAGHAHYPEEGRRRLGQIQDGAHNYQPHLRLPLEVQAHQERHLSAPRDPSQDDQHTSCNYKVARLQGEVAGSGATSLRPRRPVVGERG